MGRAARRAKRLAKLLVDGYGFRTSEWYQGRHWDSSTTPHVFHPKEEHVFTCTSAEVEGKCPIAETPIIHVPAEMWDMFIGLAGHCDTEWIALLIGKFEPDFEQRGKRTGRYLVESCYFPPQTATGTSVDVPTGVLPKPGTIGAIHSHVRMGVFFSGTDKAHSNWPMEIVINAQGNYDTMVRYQLKCGEWTKQQSKVYTIGELPIPPDPPGWAKLSRAFSRGAKLRRGAKLAEDDSSVPQTTLSQTAVPAGPASGQGSSETQLSLVSGTGGESTYTPGDSGTGTKCGSCQAPIATGATICPSCNRPTSPKHVGHIVDCKCAECQPNWHREHIPDDGSAIHDMSPDAQTTDCKRCDGTGLMDTPSGGFPYGVDVCDACNGWGKLLDGKPISAGKPDIVVS